MGAARLTLPSCALTWARSAGLTNLACRSRDNGSSPVVRCWPAGSSRPTSSPGGVAVAEDQGAHRKLAALLGGGLRGPEAPGNGQERVRGDDADRGAGAEGSGERRVGEECGQADGEEEGAQEEGASGHGGFSEGGAGLAAGGGIVPPAPELAHGERPVIAVESPYPFNRRRRGGCARPGDSA